MNIYYFGCWGRVGHHLWTPAATFAKHVEHPWGHGGLGLDGELAPGFRDPRRSHHVDEREQVEGAAALVHKDGWTALAFWDRSADRRFGSNSTFLFESGEPLEFDDAVVLAREAFATIWSRFVFKVRIA